MTEIDRRLMRLAAGGDEAAFAQLIEGSRARVHGLISNFTNADYGLERDDAYQVACTAAWTSVRSGRLNPSVDFYAQISRAVRHRLITYADHCRAECRWTGFPPVSLDALDEPGAPVLGSWISYIDPLRVVIAKDELRRCWALTTENQRQAVERYLGGDTSKRTLDSLNGLRRKVKPLLDSPYGLHPTLQVERRCRHCGGPLTGDIRARVHAQCRSAYQWRTELAAHTRAQHAVPLRLG